MEKKNTLSFPFLIIAIILGVVLFKQFDFKNLRFENTGLAVIYLIVFAFSVYILLKNYKSSSKK